MTHPRSSLRRLALASGGVCLLSLLGCGGGGGGGGSSTPSTSLAITPANADAVADASLDGAQGAVGVVSTGGGFLGKPGASSVSAFNAPRWGVARLREARERKQAYVTGKSTHLINNEVEPCDLGGQAAFQENDADSNGDISTGDSYVFTFTACAFDGFSLDGQLTINQIVISSSDFLDDDFTGSANFTFNNLAVSVGGETLTVNGSFSATLSVTGDGTLLQVTVNVTTLTITQGGNTTTLQSLTLTYTENFDTGAFSYTANGTVTDSALGGTFTVQTPTAFSGDYDVSDNPSSGVLLVQGLNSALRVTALNATQVQVEVDANGDGVFETSNVRTWDQLEIA